MEKGHFEKILIIQTAFIGDVVLATSLVEALRSAYPDVRLDFMLRKGNEALLKGHPSIGRVWVWDKERGKYQALWRLAKAIRAERYDWVIALQRFFSIGMLAAFSGADKVAGFAKNPLSFLFHERYSHELDGRHEVMRNFELVSGYLPAAQRPPRPQLYPSAEAVQKVQKWQQKPYVTLSPTSVWLTKQYHAAGWVELIRRLPDGINVYLLGGPGDREACQTIALSCGGKAEVLAGKLGFLESAALMQGSVINYVNDSAPMHFSSSVNAPTCAIFCSTVPRFGFGPLADQSWVVEAEVDLPCRPCGLHGKKACPQGHFNCAKKIRTSQLMACYEEAWENRRLTKMGH